MLLTVRPAESIGMRIRRLVWVGVLAGLLGPSLVEGQWENVLRVSFIDVGQGDAILIQGPNDPDGSPGRVVLIDGGPDTGDQNRVPLYLTRYGLPPGSVIDYVVATHPHTDHYKGLLDILDEYEVRVILDSGFPKGGQYNEFVRKAQAETIKGLPSTYVNLRTNPRPTLDWGDEVGIEILWRDGATGLGSQNTRENNASTVIRMAYGAFAFLFMGDAEGKDRGQDETVTRYVERRLIDTHPLEKLRATVLKAGDHGSETGSTLEFIQAVRPEVVVIMSGRQPFSGTFLPDETVIQRYEDTITGVEILRTDFLDEREGLDRNNDDDGDDVFMFTDGRFLRVMQARVDHQGERRWATVKVLQ